MPSFANVTPASDWLRARLSGVQRIVVEDLAADLRTAARLGQCTPVTPSVLHVALRSLGFDAQRGAWQRSAATVTIWERDADRNMAA